jgi:long-chain acyl-CoA synthetase
VGAAQYPDSNAFSMVLPNGLQQSLTFKQVDDLSTAFAAFLVAQGLQRGDVVAIQLPTSLHYPIAVMGAWKAGLIITNMNPLYTAREVALQIEDSNAKLLIASDLFANTVKPVVEQQGLPLVLCSMADFFPEPIAGAIRQHLDVKLELEISQYQTFTDALSAGAQLPPAQREAHPIALYQYTGGTTGRSKGAPLTHANLLAVLEMAQVYVNAYDVKIEPGEFILTALPLYHIFAFNFNFLLFFKLGACNVLVPNPRPLSNLKPAFAQFKIGWMTGVDTLYAGLLAEPWFTEKPLHLKYVVSGGTALRSSTATQWQQRICPILEGYGLTETSCFVSLNPPTDQVLLGCVGLPLPACEVRIVAEDGQDLPFGEAGELAVRGPHVINEYLNQPEESQASLRDGWFFTGDMAVMDENGFLQIVDRKKDIVLVSGFNVYPNEVEGVIALHPDVIEVAVIGRPDDNSGEAVCAYICSRNANLTATEIIDYCRKQLTGYKVPKYIEFREQLPKSPVGKILRAQLRDPQSVSQQQ